MASSYLFVLAKEIKKCSQLKFPSLSIVSNSVLPVQIGSEHVSSNMVYMFFLICILLPSRAIHVNDREQIWKKPPLSRSWILRYNSLPITAERKMEERPCSQPDTRTPRPRSRRKQCKQQIQPCQLGTLRLCLFTIHITRLLGLRVPIMRIFLPHPGYSTLDLSEPSRNIYTTQWSMSWSLSLPRRQS